MTTFMIGSVFVAFLLFAAENPRAAVAIVALYAFWWNA